jgi:CRP-like cAMP-binding protein
VRSVTLSRRGAQPEPDGADGWPVPAVAVRSRLHWDPGNRLLAALPLLDRALVNGELERVELVPGQTLKRPSEPIGLVIFPASGVVSLVAEPGQGDRADVGLAGREEVLGLEALFGAGRTSLRWLVRIGGEGHAIRLDALQARMRVSAALRDLLQRRLAGRMAAVASHAGCLALHALPQRLAGLLLALEHRAGPGFEITQSALAEMLNARRPTVSTELQRLRRAGLLRHARGRLAVADRDGLAALACGCHAAGCEA